MNLKSTKNETGKQYRYIYQYFRPISFAIQASAIQASIWLSILFYQRECHVTFYFSSRFSSLVIVFATIGQEDVTIPNSYTQTLKYRYFPFHITNSHRISNFKP